MMQPLWIEFSPIDVMITGMGGEDDKHSILADVSSHEPLYERLSYGKREIRLYGDTAVVTSHADIIGNYKTVAKPCT